MRLQRISRQQWYRTTKKTDGITLIDEPWIKPFYRCNIWHVQGSERGMVVDFGLGAVPLRQHVALLSESDLLAVASHTHFDRITAPQQVCPLEDGEILDLGNRQWEVIHTPGHSPGGIALWEAATQTLISGDLIYDGPLIEDLWHSDLSDYAASMRRLRKLPVRLVHGGHFPSFSGQHLTYLIDDWLRQHDL